MTRWAKDSGIPVGPGRGSAAGSAVCWLLRITEIDPFKYPGMLFERFLDVTRDDPPDIDLDFSDERRSEVRDYLADKYGQDNVGTIGNFVRYRAKNSLQDVGRVHGVPKAAIATVSSLVIERSGGDSRFGDTLSDTVGMFPDAQAVFDAYPALWKATRMEGNVKTLSIHAAGLVVANSPLTDICAVYERDGRQVLSIDKYDAEYAGMLKMDFLGLTTMGMIARCLELTGLTLEDLYAVPDTDPKTLEVFRAGDVVGIFQFEGRATRIVNRDVCPDNFTEVADINALSRPGPLFSGTTAEYIDVKHGRRKAERYHPVVDEITKDTKGQIIYQEQILRIVRDIGGFARTDANEIRRIISKKIGQAAFNVSQGSFTEGAARLHGIDEKLAGRIWRRLVTSGTYAFNIAHAISYSMLAWWTAYLKAHYPVEFYAASLSKLDTNGDAAYRMMKDAERHGVIICPPILNGSGRSWRPVNGMVVAGWEAIPGVGAKMADRIEASREKDGEFNSWDNMARIPGIGPKKVEAMEAFSTGHDPFGLTKIDTVMMRVLRAVDEGDVDAPKPTHSGEEVAEITVPWGAKWGSGPLVIYAGIVKFREYKDYVEDAHSRTGAEPDEVRKTMKRPDLVKSAVIQCIDGSDEEVYLRINRFAYPELKRTIESISVGHDVVIATGRKTPGFGSGVAVEKLYVIDPE